MNNKLKKYKRGIITIEIQSHIPEKFINLLWRNGVQIKNIRKKSITNMSMDINLKDFQLIDDIAKKTKTKIKILNRRGTSFLFIKLRKRIALVFGFFLFFSLIYFLSTFIWKIDIQTENNLSPYEIRQKLISYGIYPGIRKDKIDVYNIQKKFINDSDNIMYFKARIEGSRLIVNAVEKTPPPNVILEEDPCDLVAKKDGEILWIYTTSGTSVVKSGDIVKAGQILVKGQQGREGNTYEVHAKGEVIARTFYEKSKEISMKGTKKEKTGKEINNLYIEFLGKKIYLKNTLNKFKTYDKIIENKGFIKKEIFYETNEVNFSLIPEEVIKSTADELYSQIIESLDKSIKVVSSETFKEQVGDNYKIRVLVVAEENIAYPQKLSNN